MATNKVALSIEAPGGQRCVDIFQRPDGSWGFEEYRRDHEDGHGWFLIGFFGARCYCSQSIAQAAACRRIQWLTDLPEVEGSRSWRKKNDSDPSVT